MFYTTIVHIDNVCRYKILRFWANLQKYQTLVPAKFSHLRVFLISVVYSILLSFFHLLGNELACALTPPRESAWVRG